MNLFFASLPPYPRERYVITRWSESDRVDENRNRILHTIKNDVIGLRKCISYLAIPLVDKTFSLQLICLLSNLIINHYLVSFFLPPLYYLDERLPHHTIFNLLPHSNHPNQQVYQKYHYPFPILTNQAFLLHHPYQACLPYLPCHPWQPHHSFDS